MINSEFIKCSEKYIPEIFWKEYIPEVKESFPIMLRCRRNLLGAGRNILKEMH